MNLSQKTINQVVRELGFELPLDYLEFIKIANGGAVENDLNYIDFWPLTELRNYNDDCESHKYIPNYIIIGTDGGGTALAMHKENHSIFFTELIGMSEEDMFEVSNNFTEFMELFEREEIKIY